MGFGGFLPLVQTGQPLNALRCLFGGGLAKGLHHQHLHTHPLQPELEVLKAWGRWKEEWRGGGEKHGLCILFFPGWHVWEWFGL